MTSTRRTRATIARRTLIASSLLLGLAPLGFAADVYPSKPITLIVPYPAGGANDAVARIVGQKMGELLKQSIIVDNRAGAGGNIGGAMAAKARQMATPCSWARWAPTPSTPACTRRCLSTP